jgi:polynucleotide 5'-hydroxyl-kinase GRC3/NOL9
VSEARDLPSPLSLPDCIPEAWRRIADATLRRGASSLIIGRSDVGKSTLARFLLQEAVARGLTAALLDTDVGQSVVGPPTTIGLKVVRLSPAELADEPDALYFLGALSPASPAEMVAGTRRLAQHAVELEADVLIVDTTGLVDGPRGYRLKTAKIECLAPAHVIALEEDASGGALRHILSAFVGRKDVWVHPLERVPEAGSKSDVSRRDFRRTKFHAHFADAVEVVVPLACVALSGEPLLRAESSPDMLAGTVAAFLDGRGFAARLAVVLSLDLRAGTLRLLVAGGLPAPPLHLRLSDVVFPARDTAR